MDRKFLIMSENVQLNLRCICGNNNNNKIVKNKTEKIIMRVLFEQNGKRKLL